MEYYPGTGTTVWHGSWCKHGDPIRVFGNRTKSALEVSAGAWQQNCRPPAGSVVLDLANGFKPAIIPIGMDVPGVTWRRLVIDWPDGGVPRLRASEWRAIVDALLKLDLPVFVACQGGHGRTGTCLAVLGHYLNAYPDRNTDPVAWLRNTYCEDAVETWNQMKYIENITGRVVQGKPSYSAITYSGTTPKGHSVPTNDPGKCRFAAQGHAGCDTQGHEQWIEPVTPVTTALKPKNPACLWTKISCPSDNHKHRCILPDGHITLADKTHKCYCGLMYHDSLALEPVSDEVGPVQVRRTDGHAEWCKGDNCDPAWCRPTQPVQPTTTPVLDTRTMIPCYRCGAKEGEACKPDCANAARVYKATVQAMVQAAVGSDEPDTCEVCLDSELEGTIAHTCNESYAATLWDVEDDDELQACAECGAKQGEPCAVDCPDFREALETAGEICGAEDSGPDGLAVCRLAVGHVGWHKDGPVGWRDRV